MEVGQPLICNDLVLRRIPKTELSNSPSVSRRFHMNSSASESLSQRSHGQHMGYAGGGSSGPRSSTTRASSEASSTR